MQNFLSKTQGTTTLFLNNGWLIWGAAALFYAFEFLHRVAPSVMVAEIMQSFQVSRETVGTIAAFYFYAYALFQVPAGIICDKYGVRLVLTFASFLVAAGSFLLCISYNIELACVSRFIIGAGSAFAFVSCLKLASYWIKPKYFPIIVGLTNLCGMLGAISGGKPLAHTLNFLTWREVFFDLGLFGIVLTAFIWCIVKDKTSSLSTKHQYDSSSIKGLFYVLRHPQSWLLALYGMLLVAPIAAFAELWGIEFFQTSYSLSTEFAASFLSYIFLGIAAGGPIIGWLGSKTQRLRTIMFFGCLITIGTLCTIIFVELLSFGLIKLLLFIFGFSTSNMLLCFAVANRTFPLWASSTAIGFINMMIMGGGALFQPLIGKLLDFSFRVSTEGVYTQLSIQDFQLALSILPLCVVIAMILIIFLQQSYE